jgi:glycosyltransferase involved in cell wall biosynthesis
MMPRVSLIMTVRNGERYLARSLSSLLTQSFTDVEVIVVDNGSTDATANILADFDDFRLKIITVDSNLVSTFASGISKALNAATGEFVAVQDSDDISHESRIKKQVRFLEDNPEVGLVGTGVEWINENGDHLYFYTPASSSAEIMQSYSCINPLSHSSVMFRREIVHQFGGYNIAFSHACDFRMALDLMYSGYQISALEEPLVKIRQHSNQETALSHTVLARSRDILSLLIYAQGLPFLTKISRSRGRRQIIKAKFQRALGLLHNGNKLGALKMLGIAALEAPFYLLIYMTVRTFRGQLGDAPRPAPHLRSNKSRLWVKP